MKVTCETARFAGNAHLRRNFSSEILPTSSVNNGYNGIFVFFLSLFYLQIRCKIVNNTKRCQYIRGLLNFSVTYH